jgi:hypothetical protein
VAAAAAAGNVKRLGAGAAFVLFAAGAALGAAALGPAAELAGRYTYRFRNGDVSGAHYPSTDEVTIVDLGGGRAYVEMNLAFFNGHECAIGGAARTEGRRLVLRDPDARGFEGAPCRLEVWRQGSRLRWEDQGSCQSNCGARGGFGGGEMAWSSRRPVPRGERARILRDEAPASHRP